MDEESHKSPPDSCYASPNDSGSSNMIFPTEVARAVCGYLTSVKCHSSRSSLIEEHPDLKDFNALVQKGLLRTVDADIEGMGLLDIINDYVMMKKEIDILAQRVLPEASSYGLLRSDGPLRKLKILGKQLRSNSELESSKACSSPITSSQQGAGPKGSDISSQALIFNSRQKFVEGMKLTQQSRTMKLCEEMQTRKRKNILKVSEAEQKATAEEINRVLETNGIKRGKTCNNYRYRAKNYKDTRDSVENGEKFKGNLDEKQNTGYSNKQPISFHIKPLPETNISIDHRATNDNTAIKTAKCHFSNPQQIMDETQKRFNSRAETETDRPRESSRGAIENTYKDIHYKDVQLKTNSSPFKSRKSALKLKTPKRIKSLEYGSVSGGEKVKKRLSVFTQESNEDLMNKIIGEPLANILASSENRETGTSVTTDQVIRSTTENFCSDSDLMNKFYAVLDEIDLPESFPYNDKVDQDNNIFSETLDTSEQFGKHCSVSTPVHQPDYMDHVSSGETGIDNRDNEMDQNCEKNILSFGKKKEYPKACAISNLDKLNDSELRKEVDKLEKPPVLKSSGMISCQPQSTSQNEGTGQKPGLDPKNDENPVEIAMREIHQSPKTFVSNDASNHTTRKAPLEYGEISENMEESSQASNDIVPTNRIMIPNTAKENVIVKSTTFGTEGKEIQRISDVAIEFTDTSRNAQSLDNITLKKSSKCQHQNEYTGKGPRIVKECQKIEHTTDGTTEILPEQKIPENKQMITCLPSNTNVCSPPSFGEMISRTVKARLSYHEPPEFDHPREVENKFKKMLRREGTHEKNEPDQRQISEIDNIVQKVSMEHKNKDDPISIKKKPMASNSKTVFTSPKMPKVSKDALSNHCGAETDKDREEIGNSILHERSASSPPQRSFGYENNEDMDPRPVSSPVASQHLTKSTDFHKGLSKINETASVDNLLLNGSTGPHGIMVKIGDFRRSILVHEGSLQAGITAPSPQKRNHTKPKSGCKGIPEVESYHMILDVVTSVPNDAIPLTAAKSQNSDSFVQKPILHANTFSTKGGTMHRRIQKENTKAVYAEQKAVLKNRIQNTDKDKHYTLPIEYQTSSQMAIGNIKKSTTLAITHGRRSASRKGRRLQTRSTSNFLNSLKPILQNEINNLKLVNHIPNSNHLNTTQLVSCFAESEMTILKQQTKENILEGLSKSCCVTENNLGPVQPNPVHGDIEITHNHVTNPKHSSFQVEFQNGLHISTDETANHSPPRNSKTPSRIYDLSTCEMLGLELSNDTTSNSRHRHCSYLQEGSSGLKTPVKEPLKEKPPRMITENQASFSQKRVTDCNDTKRKKESQLSVSNMLNVEMQCKTPIKERKNSPLKKKHNLPTLPSPTAFSHHTRSPLIKNSSAKKVSFIQSNKLELSWHDII